MNRKELTIENLLEGYGNLSFKPSEVVDYFLKETAQINPKLNAYLYVNEAQAREVAKQLDGRMSERASLPLFGVPIAIKDNFLVQDMPMTAGSKILENYVAPYTATSVAKLQAAGAIVLGKTNLDEFAMGSSNENSAYGVVKNPWNLDCVPGGSSGGSAAAVSASLGLGALGTDTGGSIRQPASFCGVVGLKPTYGRVSRYGVVAFASSLDQVGPFAKTVGDVARLQEVISGYDPHDGTSSSSPVPSYLESLKSSSSIEGLRLGVAKEWLEAGMDRGVEKNFEESVEILKKKGAQIVEIELPHAKYSLSVYYLIAPSEASSNLARYDGIHYGHRADLGSQEGDLYAQSRGEGFGPEVKLRIMLGTYALSAGYFDAYYMKANTVRGLIEQDFHRAFEKVDAILAPTSPTPAFKFNAKKDDPIQMYLSDVYTLPANLAGVPAISVPSGQVEGLPVGLQIFSSHFREDVLFKVGQALMNERDEPFLSPLI